MRTIFHTAFHTAVAMMKMTMRNRRALLMKLLFPVVLILVLSMALSGNFTSRSFDLSGSEVLYSENGGAASAVLGRFIQMDEDKLGLKFIRTDGGEQAVDQIRNNRYTAYIAAEGDTLTYYKNSNPAYSFEAEAIEPSLRSFALRAGAVAVISAAGGGSTAPDAPIGSYTKTVSLDMQQQSALDYFSVVILLMITLFGATTGVHYVSEARIFRTDRRFYVSPISQYAVFIGRMAGAVAVNFAVDLLLIAVSALLGANWGGDLPLTLFIILCAVAFSQAFGITLGMLIKNTAAVNVIINFVIPVVAFFGGCFIPIQSFSGILLTLSDLSPIKWAAQGIFDSIAGASGSAAALAVAINLGLAALLLAASAFKLSRERELK